MTTLLFNVGSSLL